MALDHILRPITINGLEIKNRIARAAHGTSYGRGVISEDLIAYHEARGRSGVGLNILEATVVHRSSANHTVELPDPHSRIVETRPSVRRIRVGNEVELLEPVPRGDRRLLFADEMFEQRAEGPWTGIFRELRIHDGRVRDEQFAFGVNVRGLDAGGRSGADFDERDCDHCSRSKTEEQVHGWWRGCTISDAFAVNPFMTFLKTANAAGT